MRAVLTSGTKDTVPNLRTVDSRTSGATRVPFGRAAMLPARYGSSLSLLRQAPRLRPVALALDGRHQAAVRSEPPESAHPRVERCAPARVRLHALPQGRQDHQGLAAAR